MIAQGRLKTAPTGRVGADRDTRRRQQVLSPQRHMAAFDLENTLVASNVVASWGWLATKRMPTAERARLVARTLAEAPRLLGLDRHDRSDFLRHFYRRYRNEFPRLRVRGHPQGLHRRLPRYSVDRIHAVARLSAYSFQRFPAWAAVHRSRQPGWAR